MKRLSNLVVLAGLLFSAPVSYAVPITYVAALGNFENPVTNSPGTGLAVVTIDTAANTLRIEVNFSGLLANVSDAHIHCCIAPPGNAAVAVPGAGALPGFPLGVTSGTYLGTFDTEAATTYRPAFLAASGGTGTGAEAALAAGLAAGQAYFNIHTTLNPGGEIRQFLTQRVAEPSSVALLLAGIFGLALARKFAGA